MRDKLGRFVKGHRPSPKTEFKKGHKNTDKQREKASEMNKGNKNFFWKDGKTISKGYLCIHSPNHPYCDGKNYVREHRLIAEEILKRYLEPEERIHHINGDKLDNRPENLYYFPNENEHQRHHGWKDKPELESNLLESLL